VPNWLHLVTSLLYHLGLAIWIGGAIALGALAAPALFRELPRPQAGGIFGVILRRFARLRLAALVMIILAAAIKYLVWESHTRSIWIGIRWAAISVMAATVLYEIFYLEGAIEKRDERFPKLHKRAERLMSLSVLAALVAMFLN
jgi:uncharacterized membrane protein